MANKLYEETHIQSIADGIRRKNRLSNTMVLSEMPFAISEADTSPYGKMPSYWKESVNNVISTINNLVASDKNYIPLGAYFSDMHVRYKYSPNYGYTGILSAMVMNATQMPFALCTGDIGASSGNGFTKESEMIDCFEDVNDILAPIGWNRLLVTQGNHDGSWGTVNGKAYAYQMSPQKLYNYIYRKLDTSNHIFGGGDNSYYYADYAEKKIRVIMLNSLWCETSENSDGTAVYDRQHYFGFGQAQLNWLANTALSFDEEGWTVFIATHVPPISAQSSYYRDMAILHGILTAYCDKASYTGSYTYNSGKNEGTWANVSISVNFASKITGKIVGFLCGHVHKDTIDTTTYKYPIVTITSDADLSYDDAEETRVVDTDNEHAIDFITINPVKEEVVLTRLGVGVSRVYSYKGTVLYSVTSNLTNVTTNNGSASIEEGSSYTATLSVASNCEMGTVKVTMGGVDVTSSVYSNGVITISEVTGDIVITANATAKPNYTNLAQPNGDDWHTDCRLNSSCSIVSNTGTTVTNLIECTRGDIIRVYGMAFDTANTSYGYMGIEHDGINNSIDLDATYANMIKFDSNGVGSFLVLDTSGDGVQDQTAWVDVTGIRLCGKLTVDKSEVIITKNEVIS